jgi:glycosyltransferase involved in cell wall biosynthesis
LWRYLKAEPPDILHSLLFHANIAARFVGLLAGIPVRRIICEIQTVEVERRWHLWVDGLTYRLCRFEVANSPSVLEHLHRHARIPRERLRCEWGAVDHGVFTLAVPSDRDKVGVTPDENLIVWTGRLDPIKGFEEMLGACRWLKGERTDFKLLVVGEGPYRPTIERLIVENGLENHVKLLGQRFDVPNILKAADLFVFCSRTEGLPNSLLEAMAAGLPIVATDVPGNRDLIRDGETGLLAERENAEAIARGMRRLLADRQEARQLGESARRWVAENVDLPVWVRRWGELYEGLI